MLTAECDTDKENKRNPNNNVDNSGKLTKQHAEKTSLSSEDDEEEIFHRKKKSVLEDSTDEEEKDLVIDVKEKTSQPMECDPEKFLSENVKSDTENVKSDSEHVKSDTENVKSEEDSDVPIRKKKSKVFDSDSVASDLSSDSGNLNKNEKKKKKIKRKKKKKSESKGGSLNGFKLNGSRLTDDESDELLKDLETLLNEPNEGTEIKDSEFRARSSDSDSGSSVGMPEDMHIVRKKEDFEGGAVKKTKVYKDFNPEDWQNEEVREKDHDGKGKKSKGEKKKKGELDAVAQLVSERQKMMRETVVSLPRHEPAPLQLSDCLARIPKLTSLRPNKVEEKKPAFIPKLSSKTDEFFLPKDLGNFMGRFKKHLSLSAKVTSDPPALKKCKQTVTKQSVPQSVFIKRNIQQELKEKILAKKIEARKAAEQEKLIDEEFRTEDPEYAELQKMLDNDEEEDMSESEGEQKEEENGEEEEEKEDVDEKTDRRAEKILLGEEVSSSSEEESEKMEGKERNYHTDTDSDLLASADEVHVDELPPSSASEDDALQPSRYSLRRLTRYVRKKRLTKTRKNVVRTEDSAHEKSDNEDNESLEKIEKAKKKIELLLGKRKEMKEKKEQQKAKKMKREEERRKMEEIKRRAEEEAILAEEKRKSSLAKQTEKTKQKTVRKPWLSDSEEEEDEEDLPRFDTEADNEESDDPGHAVHPKRNWEDDSLLEARAARILAGEELSSSSEEENKHQTRKYHSDTDSDLLASADEVHVDELPPSSASEDDALQPSRYSLRRLTRYCRKKRLGREKRHQERVAIGSESEKEEKAKKKLQNLLKKREEIKKKIYEKKNRKKESSCTSIQDLFGGSGGLSLTGISRPTDSQSFPSASRDSVPISSTIIPDSMDTLPVSEKTFDVDTAVRNVVEDSQKSRGNFLPPDEDAVFLDTQGMLRSGLDISREGGIEALEGDNPDNSLDMLNLCSGQFGSANSGGFGGTAPDSGGFGGTAPESVGSGGRVTVQDISFNLTSSPDLHVSSLSQTPNPTKTPVSSKHLTPHQTPLRKGLSQTPLTRFGNLEGVLSQESDGDEEEERTRVSKKGKKRRSLYSDMLDNEAEKSGSDHSEDEYEDENDEYDRSMMAKDSELPSDEEELAAELKQAYHNQQALDEKNQIKRLKERFIQEEQGFFRTRKFHGEDSNMDLFSTNLGFDQEEDDVENSAETYKEEMEKRAERLRKEQFVKEKRLREASSMSNVDDDSQVFLDSLQDITDSNSRSAFTNSQQCGSFLKHKSGTLSRLSSVTSSSLNSEKTSNRAYVFQTVSPAQTKRKSTGKFSNEPKRPKKFTSSGVPSSSTLDSNQQKSIFNVIK